MVAMFGYDTDTDTSFFSQGMHEIPVQKFPQLWNNDQQNVKYIQYRT